MINSFSNWLITALPIIYNVFHIVYSLIGQIQPMKYKKTIRDTIIKVIEEIVDELVQDLPDDY